MRVGEGETLEIPKVAEKSVSVPAMGTDVRKELQDLAEELVASNLRHDKAHENDKQLHDQEVATLKKELVSLRSVANPHAAIVNAISRRILLDDVCQMLVMKYTLTNAEIHQSRQPGASIDDIIVHVHNQLDEDDRAALPAAALCVIFDYSARSVRNAGDESAHHRPREEAATAVLDGVLGASQRDALLLVYRYRYKTEPTL